MQQRPLMEEARLGSQQEPDGGSLRQCALRLWPITGRNRHPTVQMRTMRLRGGLWLAVVIQLSLDCPVTLGVRRIAWLTAAGHTQREVWLSAGSEGTGMRPPAKGLMLGVGFCAVRCAGLGRETHTARSWPDGGCPGRPENLKARAAWLGPA